jgi:hypothetical protein
VSDILVGLEQGFSQAVYEPEGILIAGHFADASASEAIFHTHKFSRILESKSFSDLYRKFLHTVAQWCRKNVTNVAPAFMRDIEQELAGTYKLPEPKLKPTPKPVPPPQPPQPSIERMGTKLSEQLVGDYSQFLTSRSEPDMAPEARRYLSGERLNRNRF